MNTSSESPRLTLVSGSWPPSICGVGDFMYGIWQELTQSGHTADRLTLSRGGVSAALRAWLASFHSNSLVYMSYPTEGYGRSLLPFLLALGHHHKVVLHIHEYSSKNSYCRFLLRRFQRLVRLYFSNREDYLRYVSDCGLSHDAPKAAGWCVMPTPSNIPITAADDLRSPTRVKIIHFGQIRPLKGLEELSEVMGSIRDETVDRLVIGGVPKGYETYASEISDLFARAGVTVKLNLTPEQISYELASAHVGLFAFPDGADERRGSLIAAMAHGILCVTTHSDRTPLPLKSATIGIEIEDGSSVSTLAGALRKAVAEVNTEENRKRIALSREISTKASFRGIVEHLLQHVPLQQS